MPENAQRDRIWLIIGGRNTGKSVLLKDLLYKTQRNTDLCMGMTGTISTADMFRTCMPPDFVYQDGYDYDKADQYLTSCTDLAKKGKVRHTTICLDDVVFDPKVFKNKTQQALHLNGRHFKTSVFETTQYAMVVPTVIRANIDYVIALRDCVTASKRRLFENFYGIFPSYAEFDKVFTEVTKNYGALVLDRTQTSGNITDLITHYRASPSLPGFSLGKPIFFKLGNMYNNSKKKREQSGIARKNIKRIA